MSDERLSYGSEDLIRKWRERFTGRRTVNREMLEQAELLVRDAVACELALGTRERLWELERREREAERSVHRAELERDRMRVRAEGAELDLAQHRAKHERLREEQSVEDGQTIVRITAPQVPYSAYGYSSNSHMVAQWTLESIEDLTYRMRMAGAQDETVMVWKKDEVVAAVPFPEFALSRTETNTESETGTPEAGSSRSMSRRERNNTLLLCCVYAVVVMVLTTIGIVLGR